MKPALIASFLLSVLIVQVRASESTKAQNAFEEVEARVETINRALQDLIKFSRGTPPSTDELTHLHSTIKDLYFGDYWNETRPYQFHPNDYFFNEPFKQIKEELMMHPRDYLGLFERAMEEGRLDIMGACIQLQPIETAFHDYYNGLKYENRMKSYSESDQKILADVGYDIRLAERIKALLGVPVNILIDKSRRSYVRPLKGVIVREHVDRCFKSVMQSGDLDGLERMIQLGLTKALIYGSTTTESNELAGIAASCNSTESVLDYVRAFSGDEAMEFMTLRAYDSDTLGYLQYVVNKGIWTLRGDISAMYWTRDKPRCRQYLHNLLRGGDEELKSYAFRYAFSYVVHENDSARLQSIHECIAPLSDDQLKALANFEAGRAFIRKRYPDYALQEN